MEIVIALLLFIILLLCTPQTQRWKEVVTAAILYVLWRNAPLVLALVMGAASWLRQHLIIAILAGVMSWVLVILVLYGLDQRENAAIRAGSTIAFARRVKTLMRDSKYSYEQAVAAAERVRDRKK